ncbi:MAG: phosphotransferase system enzyme I (PtsI), partial [Candidatus Omnitrophota bacterium]
MSEIVLQGISASPGIAFGNAFILDKQEFVVAPRSILANEVPSELARFEEAILCTKQEIKNIQTKLSSSDAIHDAKIFDAHLMILEDPKLLKDVNQRIESENYSCEYIFSEVIKMYVDKFLKIEDEYLRERAGDVKDIARRVLTHLIHENRMDELDDITEELILIGHDLSPSDTASMYSKNIIAFATDIGGKTSHTAIMAKSLGVPAVVGVKDATLRIHNQDFLIIDGTKGVVIVNPTEETLVQYHSQQDKIEETKGRFEDIKDLPSQTTDGKRIGLFANVELKEEIPSVLKYGADGIGLYRTEFFYMNRVDLPTEQEQFETYKEVAENIKPSCVT